MYTPSRRVFTAWIALLVIASSAAATPVATRERVNLDRQWRFALGHASDPARDFGFATGYFSYFAKAGYGDGAADPKFDDRGWRVVDVPHDWAVELPFDPRGTASHGFKSVGRNFPENSVGWYRKTIHVDEAEVGRRFTLEFDGVFRDSDVFVNGFHCGREPSGYSSFAYDITDYLNYGGDNVVAVRVNASMEEGWFYEGAGIYRHVWLTKTSPVHVAQWGTFVTTAVAAGAAKVSATTTLANDGKADVRCSLEQHVFAPDGREVAHFAVASPVSVPAGNTVDVACDIDVPNAQLWSLAVPALYRLQTTVRLGEGIADMYETTFGIRTIAFDPDRGFFLNGERVELKGVNLHQDHAGVGVAVPDALHDFRIDRIKAFGANAVRCAHNPPAPEFLDACDRNGILVIDENRLMGTNAAQLDPLERMIRRDRNHPSVILWSIGNEEWAIEGNIKGARIAATMQEVVRRLDPTRRVTAANSGGWGGISTVIDVIGYNYISQSNPDEQHRKFPQQPGVGTEETTTQETRGVFVDDREHVHLGPQEKGDSGGNSEKGWKYYAERPFLAGLFYWTGFDYRGEPTPFGWPAINSQMGLLDTCGFRKDSSYYQEAWWTDRPVLHLATHWNWPGREGQPIKVVCFSNADEVELLLNGASLGKKPMPRNSHLEWEVPYQPGTLEARGFRGGKVAQTEKVETTGAAVELRLIRWSPTSSAGLSAGLGRSTEQARRDGGLHPDIAVFTVEARDGQGRFAALADNAVDFAVTGGRVIGVGNGDPGCHEPDQFVASVQLVPVADWRGRIAPSGTTAPSDSAAMESFLKLGNWFAPRPKEGEVYDLAGTLTLPDVPRSGRLNLFLPTFGRTASVWLNGQRIAADVDTTKVGPGIPLEPGQLVVGANRLHLIVTPYYEPQNHIPEKTQLGSLSIALPAPVARRSLFNGLAQVVVQADAGAGEIRLVATSTGLKSAEANLTFK
jgi:beta-galactosidase